jgi:hypothetical protein
MMQSIYERFLSGALVHFICRVFFHVTDCSSKNFANSFFALIHLWELVTIDAIKGKDMSARKALNIPQNIF